MMWTDLLSRVPAVAWVVIVILFMLVIVLGAYWSWRGRWCSDMVDVIVSHVTKGISSADARTRVRVHWSPRSASVYWDAALMPERDAARVLAELADLLDMEPTTVSPQRRGRRYYVAFHRGDRS